MSISLSNEGVYYEDEGVLYSPSSYSLHKKKKKLMLTFIIVHMERKIYCLKP